MMTRTAIGASVMGLLLMIGCAKTTGTEPAVESPPPAPGSERPAMTAAECEAQGGRIVGDIGDGAIHRPDYTCDDGQPPIGSIRAAEGEPVAIEGAVCCPAAP